MLPCYTAQKTNTKSRGYKEQFRYSPSFRDDTVPDSMTKGAT